MRTIKLGCEKIFYGEGAIGEIKTLDGPRKKAFIVMSGTILEETGGLKLVTDQLSAAGFQWQVYSDVEPEPSFQSIQKGVVAMNQFEPDWVIGFGGGSAMDAAKAMWVFYENPQYKQLTDAVPPNPIKNLNKKAHIACIATSAGTGSEATRAAQIKDLKLKQKFPLVDMNGRLVPKVAFLDPIFTKTMPKGLTAGSGMDVITHAIESYVSPTANPFSMAMSMGSFITAYQNLVKTYENINDDAAREKMLAASCMGGIAFSNSALGLVHSIAHTFGAEYNIPHGLANAIVLPYVIKFNQKDTTTQSRYQELASFVGEQSLLEAMLELRRDLNIPGCMKEMVADEAAVNANIDGLVEKAMGDICSKVPPIKPSAQEMKELILQVYNGS